MAKLLYIECSPRKQISASIEVCRAFLDAYPTANPADTIQTLDIWDLAMPEFNGDAPDGQSDRIEAVEAARALAQVF
jgi:FMN-dependent NADH-azoreductase